MDGKSDYGNEIRSVPFSEGAPFQEQPRARIEPSGSTNLDAVLPGGGWQGGTIVELMPVCDGIGELRLLMPALAKITHSERHVAMIAPPYIPFAPALLQHGLRLEHFWIIRAQTATDILWSTATFIDERWAVAALRARGRESAGGAQLVRNRVALSSSIARGSQIFPQSLGRFGALAAGFIHRGLRHFDINDSRFDELAPLECVHRMNPSEASD